MTSRLPRLGRRLRLEMALDLNRSDLGRAAPQYVAEIASRLVLETLSKSRTIELYDGPGGPVIARATVRRSVERTDLGPARVRREE